MKREPYINLPVRLLNDERLIRTLNDYGDKGLGVLFYAMLQFSKMHGMPTTVKQLGLTLQDMHCSLTMKQKIIVGSGFFDVDDRGYINALNIESPSRVCTSGSASEGASGGASGGAPAVPISSNNINSNSIMYNSASASPTTEGNSSLDTRLSTLDTPLSPLPNSEEQQFLAWLSGLSNVCAMQHSITFAEFLSLIALGHTQQQVMDKLVRLNNMRNAPKRYLSAYQTVKEWLQTSAPYPLTR